MPTPKKGARLGGSPAHQKLILSNLAAQLIEHRAITTTEAKAKTQEFKDRLEEGETLDDILVEAFATVREASWRILRMRPFHVQVMGGIAGVINATGAITWIVAPVSATALYGWKPLSPFLLALSLVALSCACAWWLLHRADLEARARD